MPSLANPSLSSSIKSKEARVLYFAYGSNMHLQQMAARCPESSLFGIGVLPNYRWQTNTRGGGNVVESSQGDAVEGIVFEVSPSDVETLRHHEGVEQGNFVEQTLEVEMRPALDRTLEGRRVNAVIDILAQRDSQPGLADSDALTSNVIQDHEYTRGHGVVGDQEAGHHSQYSHY
ncbi:AIG2 family protein [Seiridium cupressi]